MLSKEEFDYCTARMPRPCVDLVFLCKGKILLMKRIIEPDKGLWALPGGSILLGETVEQAAVRKAREETGIIITEQVLKVIGILTYFGKTRQDICITYAIELPEYPIIVTDFQHEEGRWFDAMPAELSSNARVQLPWAVKGI